jgi:hypothetical protein
MLHNTNITKSTNINIQNILLLISQYQPHIAHGPRSNGNPLAPPAWLVDAAGVAHEDIIEDQIELAPVLPTLRFAKIFKSWHRKCSTGFKHVLPTQYGIIVATKTIE